MKSRKLGQPSLAVAVIAAGLFGSGAAYGQNYSPYRHSTPTVVSYRHAIPSTGPASRHNHSPDYPFASPYGDYDSCDQCEGGYDPLLHRCPNGSCQDNRRSWRHCWPKTCYDPKPAYALPNYGYHATSWRKMTDGGTPLPYPESYAVPYEAPQSSSPSTNGTPEQAPGATETPESAPESAPAPNNTTPNPPSPAIDNPTPAPTAVPEARLRAPQQYEEALPEVEAGLAPYPGESTPTIDAKEVIPQKPTDSPGLVPPPQNSDDLREDGEEPEVFLPPLPVNQQPERQEANDLSTELPEPEKGKDENWGAESESDENSPINAPKEGPADPTHETPGENRENPTLEQLPSDDAPLKSPIDDEFQTTIPPREQTVEERWEMPIPHTGPDRTAYRRSYQDSSLSRGRSLGSRNSHSNGYVTPTANWSAPPAGDPRRGNGVPSASSHGANAQTSPYHGAPTALKIIPMRK